MDREDNDLKTMLKTITAIVIGGAIVWYLFYKPTTQPVGSTSIESGSQYKNDEVWELNRSVDGRIANLRVSRDAQINDGGSGNNNNKSTTVYRPLESPINQISDNRISNTINVDQLTNMVQNRLQKRWVELNKKTNDYERQRRFGMI